MLSTSKSQEVCFFQKYENIKNNKNFDGTLDIGKLYLLNF